MNDQDLERDLRTQRSPREEGYVPARLPMTLDEAPVARRGASRLPRAVLLVGAGVAGALAVAIGAGILSGSDPGVGTTDSASPSAAASTPVAGGGACGPQDVSLTAEPWGGAAGSRGTVVTVALAAGRDACTLGKGLAAEIADAKGSVLVTTGPSPSGGPVMLAPGGSFTIGITWSNWCVAAPAAPVALAMQMSGWESFVTVPVPTGGLDPVPPCIGSTEPTALSRSVLEPQ
ncbi:MAG: DUF4232 domain-containing protein [Chloroflexi bacterium]|nr:DUF4232 domain-containing protein [Chloroflexota bacterium]